MVLCGAYRLFPTDLHIPPMPWRSDLLTTPSSMQGAAAKDGCLEREPGDFLSEWKTNRKNLPQAWILDTPSTDGLFYAAFCAIPPWSQCQDSVNKAMQT